MGALNYYRLYISRMAELAAPLYALTKKEVPWLWDECCRKSFDVLRDSVAGELIIFSLPKWILPFYVEAYASASVVAVLSQEDTKTGKILPICHFFVVEFFPEELQCGLAGGLGYCFSCAKITHFS